MNAALNLALALPSPAALVYTQSRNEDSQTYALEFRVRHAY